LGIPEALWVFEMENFGPLIATIDSTGRNYAEEIVKRAKARESELLSK
jgi:tartrate dehydratase beta subunit/fumarate hydratase class I family protein